MAEDEAALRRRDQTVIVVPKRLVPTITRMIAKAGQREQSSALRPNNSLQRDRSLRAAPSECEAMRLGCGGCGGWYGLPLGQ